MSLRSKRKREGWGECGTERLAKRFASSHHELTEAALHLLHADLVPNPEALADRVEDWNSSIGQGAAVSLIRDGSTPLKTPSPPYESEGRSRRPSRASALRSETGSTVTAISDPAVPMMLNDSGVLDRVNSVKPANYAEIMAVMERKRGSLSPSAGFDQQAWFNRIEEATQDHLSEMQIQRQIVDGLVGPARFPEDGQEANMEFNNLKPLTSVYIPPAKPDIYEGSRPHTLEPKVRRALHEHVVPNTKTDKPLAPNFSVEVKSNEGSAQVMATQARYNGAVGARAIHALQSYGQSSGSPQFDNRASSYAATYHYGKLLYYATHAAAGNPHAATGNAIQYHNTYLGSRSVTDTPELMVDGIQRLRNLKDQAHFERLAAIDRANKASYSISPSKEVYPTPPLHTSALQPTGARPSIIIPYPS